jgi:GTP-binding protein
LFVDEARIHVRAGDGGAGVVSFQRRRGKPRGKPVGGSGGSGGDVIVRADPSMATLLEYQRRPHRKAAPGSHGSGDLRHGRRGDDLVLPVPVGTVVRDAGGTVLADLARPGQQVTLLGGGRGGKGNAALMGPESVAPSFAEQGEYGGEAWFSLELKLIADAAIVGFPNAGKSTLISRVSAARPRIADYPFTTLHPHPGVVSVDGREYVIVDIPGLVEGAAEGRGLGHAFLRHVERSRALLLLLDPSPLQEHPVADQYRILREELATHSPEMVERPMVVAVSKADLPEAAAAASGLEEALGAPVASFSAVTGVGLEELLHRVADAIASAPRESPDRDGYVLHRPLPPGFEVSREGDTWMVEGEAATRAVAFDDLTLPAAADLAARRLARAGIEDALRAAGARDGDEVRIGDVVFEFRDDDADGGGGRA